jgi:hypothetical protein
MSATSRAAALLVAGCVAGRENVIEVSRQVAALPPAKVEVAAVPIAAVDVRAPLPAATAVAPCSRPNCNAALNSRLPAAAPAKVEVRWSAPYVEAFEPSTVLQDKDRVLAYGGGVWRLYDLDGKPLQDGRVGPSGMVLDGANGLFYFVNHNGFFAAHRLADGGVEFTLDVAAGDAWPFLARLGRRVIDVAMETPQQWRQAPPNHVAIERLELPEKLELDRVKSVTNLEASETLHLKVSTVLAALQGDRLVFAVPGRIFSASTELQPQAAFDGDFIPQRISLD